MLEFPFRKPLSLPSQCGQAMISVKLPELLREKYVTSTVSGQIAAHPRELNTHFATEHFHRASSPLFFFLRRYAKVLAIVLEL